MDNDGHDSAAAGTSDAQLSPLVIRQGDYLDRLAFLHGFVAKEVWEHPKNEHLRKRRDPNILYPGDVMWIPRKRAEGRSVTAKQGNPYQAQLPTTNVKLRFISDIGAIENTEVTVHLPPSPPVKLSTDGDGVVSLTVPVNLPLVRMQVHSKPEQEFTVLIGHTDPVDTWSGSCKRLAALGYLDVAVKDVSAGGVAAAAAAAVAALSDDELELLDESVVKRAVKALQRKHKLHPSGNLDQTTKERLVAEHGS